MTETTADTLYAVKVATWAGGRDAYLTEDGTLTLAIDRADLRDCRLHAAIMARGQFKDWKGVEWAVVPVTIRRTVQYTVGRPVGQ